MPKTIIFIDSGDTLVDESSEVREGVRLGFAQRTRYPFGDAVSLLYTGEEASFTLSLRVPSWSRGETLRVNGEPVSAMRESGYLHLARRFLPGDRVELELSSAICVIPWHFGAAAIRKGAVLYCFPVAEEIRELDDEAPYREITVPARGDRKIQEFFPASSWNYALDVRRFVCRENSGPIFLTPENPPAYLKAWGTPEPLWKLAGNAAGPLPERRLPLREGGLRELTLIPYACTRLKIALFPRLYPVEGNVRDDLRCEARRLAGCVQVDFDTVPGASELLLLVQDETDTLYRLPRNTYKGGRLCPAGSVCLLLPGNPACHDSDSGVPRRRSGGKKPSEAGLNRQKPPMQDNQSPASGAFGDARPAGALPRGREGFSALQSSASCARALAVVREETSNFFSSRQSQRRESPIFSSRYSDSTSNLSQYSVSAVSLSAICSLEIKSARLCP